MSQSLRIATGLAAILSLEVVVYAPSFQKFYCGDSLFYFSRLLEDWSHLVERFRTLDDLGQYRPFTYVFFTYFVHPCAGLSLFRNHIFPLGFHGLNTILVYFLSRRLFFESWQRLLVAFFFGVSTIAAYVTYDNTFIPDYLYVFFYLSALVALCHSLERNPLFNFILAAILFLLALFSKEAAVTFPVAAFIVLVFGSNRSVQHSTGKQGSIGWRKCALLCLPFVLAVLVYVGWHLVMKQGSLYPEDLGQPHRLDLSWTNIKSKTPALAQALGLPANFLPGKKEWPEVLLVACLLPLISWMSICSLRGLFLSQAVYRAGLLWSLVTLVPALFVVAQTWAHNLYLPLVGLSWIFAESISEARNFVLRVPSRARLASFVVGYAIFGLTWAAITNGTTIRGSSWMARGSEIAKNCLADLQRMYPRIPPNTLLYVEVSRGENIAWYFDSGRMPATLYGDPSIRMRFSNDGRLPPSEKMLQTGKVKLLKYIEGRLYDVTERRRLEKLDIWSYRIRDHWQKGTAQFDGKEYSLPNPVTLPPGHSLVFPFDLGLEGSGRDTLVLVSGVTYSHVLPAISPGSHLRFGVALASLRGKSVLAEVRLVGPNEKRKLYSRQLLTNSPDSELEWDDRIIDLAGVQGSGYTLQVVSHELPGRTVASNWVEWGPLEIVPPPAQNLVLPPPTIPPQPLGIQIYPSPVRKGESITVEVMGGEEMEVDCRYTLISSNSSRTLMSWLTTDRRGRQSFVVNTPGSYVFTAIRNGLRSDWVPIHYEWSCLP